MRRDSFDQKLEQLSPGQEAEVEALAAEYLAQTGEVLSVAVHAAGTPPPLGPKALSVVSQLREAAARPLAAAVAAREVPDAWMLIELARAVDAARTSITARLHTALRDVRLLRPQNPPHIEEPEPPFRVCDEAYLALRRVEVPESMLQYTVEMRHFLDLSDSEKDREIHRYLETRSFTTLPGNEGGEA
jgi:hypothetical protein